MSNEDTYKTIKNASEVTLFKEKSSKFFGYAFPISHEDEVKNILENLKKQHHTARHFCFAYQLGVSEKRFRVNDDGEPSNSAGMPIYGQIQAFDLTNILVVSVRYFGGTKLGVGGLMSAYKISAQFAIEASEIIEKTVDNYFLISFNYDLMNKVLRIIKEFDILIIAQKLEMNCEYEIAVRKSNSGKVYQIFKELYQVSIKKLES
ncbi:MAG: YigZ family protein [Flavobacteriia bacterium]|nr:YigZ family protein [Flavobacteriia bacterium]OIP47297.1 MAG: YigZ family protein [Flavobacteriaceae bacterium CG2_30_31_66]PIV96121.1 MAG: YigZ family protein [Flavobacteriaceae bacterium CG17_big_fil_post_rev_8_21_14_2_50_31_13]PIX13047.1 MAG: YigZ family protein [Flavobacteriaceae bacterium CG_4_8_14_3_um_filter_31_8]PIY14338.1 MAG: YigZ family protein [Flavobacteriaceae bacterium CG_4_10_14_3_um_filter_31_253]PIZ10425.1 MAG: YigZ family protein [Flavobacteriaceae bacterium CG_4_10_14_0_